MKWLIFAIIFLLLPSMVLADSGKIRLVTAVTDGEEVKAGNTPEMFLEVRPGNGNIYIDSLPLTRIDTQISTRFANAVACDFLDTDCSQHDFFYKLRTGTNVIGGPSAGAGITVLTVAVLDNQQIRQDVVMTGTINSGGLVGPVGGLREKALASHNEGLVKLLVPSLALGNKTSIENISENLSIDIMPVSNLEEALFEFTGKDYSKELPELEVPEFYTKTMTEVADKLCNRFDQIMEKEELGHYEDENNSLYNSAVDFFNRSVVANEEGDQYARASYCFSGSLRLRELDLNELSQEELLEGFHGINNRLNLLDEKVDSKKFNTMSDLETYMIVKERVAEARDVLGEINSSNISSSSLAYAFERLYSGVFWSDFFDKPGNEFNLENEQLRDSCFEKIEEAKERIDYLSVTFSAPTERLSEDLSLAHLYFDNQDYGLCLFKASKVKADADMILTVLFVDVDQTDKLLDEKIVQTEKVIRSELAKGQFPILGYSYYEYALSLQDRDPYSSLIYLEYAMELSNLDMYFPPKKSFRFVFPDISYIFGFIFGIIVGGIIVILIQKNQVKIRKNPRRPPKGNLPGKKR